LGGEWRPVQVFSTQLRYVLCALGRCDVVTRIPKAQGDNTYVWDHAGGMLLFGEVGGKTTDLEGKEIDCGVGRKLDANVGTLAAPVSVHGKVLEAARKVLREFSDYELDW
jgi:3'(2'), 5'-bisphosphate nucleotidase